MVIYNPNGSRYQPSGTLQQFDPENLEHDLFNTWDQEVIQIGGTPIFYYEVFINLSSIDELYVEARDKIYSEQPICLYGYYDPKPSENMMGMFGMDSPMTEMMMEFNYRHVLKTLGHAPKIGARLYTPHKRENWIVIQRNVEVFQLWGEIRLQVMCNRFPESLTTGEGRVTQREPDFKINSVKDLGGHQLNFAGGQSGS
jgi:hypothetical protein